MKTLNESCLAFAQAVFKPNSITIKQHSELTTNWTGAISITFTHFISFGVVLVVLVPKQSDRMNFSIFFLPENDILLFP